ncbi:MAG: cation:proton antiporter [Pseudomonadota bacterium]
MAATEVDYTTYKDALLVLGTAGVAVPLLHRFRVSPVLGFLIVGAILSPSGLGMLSSTVPAIDWITVSSPNRVAQIAELGIVFLMFLIGLEPDPVPIHW